MAAERRPAAAAGWLIVAPLLAVATARVVAWDSRSILVALNALTPLLYLPTWPVAVAAGLGRRWALCATAATVVIAHVAFMTPELAARTPTPATVAGSRAIRLFSANVYAGNTRAAGIAREIRDAAPDLVFLQEATPAIVDAIDATGALDELPHRVAVRRTDPFGALLASRWPLADQDVVELERRPIAVRATIDTGDGPIRLYAVHVIAPFGGGREAWRRELGHVAGAVGAETGPVIVAGDFNATWGHRAFRRLLDAGLTDAAAARGRPFQMTWDRSRRFVGPLARIDHVLTTPALTVTAIRTGEGLGSDHRPLIADVTRVHRAS
ncbi:MAG: endonuclease/exonuclease/phosphatase family protein [Acidimicrobiales bacterium]